MPHDLITRINHGYRDIEAAVLGLMALNRSFMLIGRHGTGKTRLARVLSGGYGEDGFVFYDATKDDLVSIAGIPAPESLKTGRLEFVPHQRSIWDKSTIVVDEITRASKENQNLWLEIIEQRTCFGLDLPYRTLIATANPESYAAAFQLDEALLDRFYAVIPVPEMQDLVDAEDVAAMVRLAVRPHGDVEPAAIARVFAAIQKEYADLVEDGARERVAAYLGRFVPGALSLLARQDGAYLSPRAYARNLPEAILACAASHAAAGAQSPLESGARDAVNYALATKLQLPPTMFLPLHEGARSLLSAGQDQTRRNVRLEIGEIQGFEDRLQYLAKNWPAIQSQLQPDELEKITGELLRGASRKGEHEKLVLLRERLTRLGYQGDALRQIDGTLLITLNKAVNLVLPRLGKVGEVAAQERGLASGWNQFTRFRDLVAAGGFLASRHPEVMRLQMHLIEVYEGDATGGADALLEFFATLDLPEAEHE